MSKGYYELLMESWLKELDEDDVRTIQDFAVFLDSPENHTKTMIESIETAPQDGTWILVWDTSEKCWQKVAWLQDYEIVKRKSDPYRWCIYGTYGEEMGFYQVVDNPLVWMPLPRDYEK